MTVAARRILVEYDTFEAAATLVSVVARREDRRRQLRAFAEMGGEVADRAMHGVARELRDVESAERALRAALGVPADQEWVETELREAWGK